MTGSADWSVRRASAFYAVKAWGAGYFRVAADGRLMVAVDGQAPAALADIVDGCRRDGLRLPILLRFPQILESRVEQLRSAFVEACRQHHYQGSYNPVYPIKVNQQRTVVETLAGVKGVGLEAGSKPELIAVLAQSRPGGIVVCNGYKDREYVRLALMGQKLGLQVYIVLEKPHELALVLEQAEALGVEPMLGGRLRLASIAGGNWQDTGGERAKFGLSASQLLEIVQTLRSRDRLSCLRMLHFHMGSQIPNLRDIQRGVHEAGRFFVELCAEGAAIRVLNIGGGLGVDYEGTQSRSACSTNYGMQQYAGAIVHTLAELCDRHRIPHPDLVSESGRALSAHHAVLVTNVAAVESLHAEAGEVAEDAPGTLRSMAQLLAETDQHSPQELYLEAGHYLEEGRNLFLYGDMNLRHRAQLDRLYVELLSHVRHRLNPGRRRDRELLDQLHEKLADKYFVNLSIFQSLPDVWGLDQVFPIVPLSRLDQPPVARAIIEDLTCDSDGRISRFAEDGGVETTLAVHPVAPGEQYLLGLFLAGAYQETLGDIHNLFGDTDSVDVSLEADGFRLDNLKAGDDAAALLRFVGFDPTELERRIRQRVSEADLAPAETRLLEASLKSGLAAYTYLEAE